MNLETSKKLLSLSRKETNARKRMRLLAISLFFDGENRTNIAKRLNVAVSSVNKWVSDYLAYGLMGLNNKPISGRPPKLTSSELKKSSNYIKQHPSLSEGGRLTGEDITRYITEEFDINYSPNHIYKLLRQIGFSWITSRSKHPKQSQEILDALKKVSPVNDPSQSI